MTISAETKIPRIDARIEFWSLRGARWPRDWHKHIFAGRVVHRTGKLLYRQAWTGDEPETVCILPLPARLDSATRSDEIAWAIELLNLFYPPYMEKYRAALDGDEAPPLPTVEEWQCAVGISRQISNESYAAVQRFRNVVEFLVALLERGILRAALRPFYLGDPESLLPGAWYNEVYLAWFSTCQVNLEQPFSGIPVRAGGHWIMFEAQSFEAWEASVGTTQQFSTDSAHTEADGKPEPTESSDVSSTDPSKPGNTAESVPEQNSAQQTHEAPAQFPSTTEMNEDAASVGSVGSVVGKRRKRAGAKQKYPWKEGSFEQRVIELVQGDARPRSMHELVDQILEWCSLNWPSEPSKTTITNKIEQVLARRGVEFP